MQNLVSCLINDKQDMRTNLRKPSPDSVVIGIAYGIQGCRQDIRIRNESCVNRVLLYLVLLLASVVMKILKFIRCRLWIRCSHWYRVDRDC